MRRPLIAICLMLLLCPIGWSQAGNVVGFASYGTTVDADGYVSDIGYLGAGTFLSESIFLIGQVGGAGSGLGATEDTEYGIGTSIGYLLSNKFAVVGGIWGVRDDNEGDAPILNYATVGGALSYFPTGSGLFQEGEKIGLTLGVQYTPGTQQFLYGVGITVLGGK